VKKTAVFYTKIYSIRFMNKNGILTWAVTIFFATLAFVIVEILAQDITLVDVIGFAAIFGIGFPIISTILAKRIEKSK
jgi:hypothetical protein